MSTFKIYPTIPCDEDVCEEICTNITADEYNCIPMSAYGAMSKFELMPRMIAMLNILVNAGCRKYDNKKLPRQTPNKDYLDPKKIGMYSKGLPHNNLGEVDLNAYASLENAIQNGAGRPELFDQIIMGGPRKLVNPQAGLSFDLEGFDSHFMVAPPAPSVYSKEAMDELLENYWMSLTRDISFSDYETNPLTIAAALDLSSKAQFYGPRISGQVTTGTLFRGSFEGDLVGPYISQFLYLPCPYGASQIEQKIITYPAGLNYMTDYTEFLRIQNGGSPPKQQTDPVAKYIRNGRDLSAWVHMDILYGAYFNAMNILMTPVNNLFSVSGIGCPLDKNNPYKSPNPSSVNQGGFVTFGDGHLSSLLAEVSQRGLKVTWYQKFFIQKRLRPEAMAGLIYNEHNNLAQYGLNKDYLNSTYFSQPNSNYLLEQAFPEGSPLHPSYLAGHSTVSGACVTILKAWFDTDYVIPHPVKPSADGLTLEPYVVGVDGPELTVLGELNKLASNIGLGRNISGVHYRSDYLQSTLYGEELAISILQDQAYLYNEDFKGFVLTKFDGTKVLINKDVTVIYN